MEDNHQEQTLSFKDTTATRKVFGMSRRIRAVAGGTSASKTISILVWLIDYCQRRQSKIKTVHVVSESFPHLELGSMADFKAIMKDRGYWKQERWHGTKYMYTFETGNTLQFLSMDTGKAHGPRRDVLFVNEANNLEYKTVDQLITRTREIVWLDWNPSEEFYFYTEMLPHRDDIDFITLTYLDNEALDAETVREIESHKGNKMWWQVYGLGQLGEIESRIYTGWKTIDDVPHEARLERYGIDFGYSNDPTAIIALYYHNGGYIVDEIAFSKGMTNKDIADIFKNLEKKLIIADAAEPKSIDELRTYSLSVLPCKKGQGSVNQGIQYVQQQKMSVTKRSLNVLKEYKNYLWLTDKEDNIINEPQDFRNHSMDAIRYAMASVRRSDALGAHTHYAQSSMPLGQQMPSLPPELQDRPKTAPTFNPFAQ